MEIRLRGKQVTPARTNPDQSKLRDLQRKEQDTQALLSLGQSALDMGQDQEDKKVDAFVAEVDLQADTLAKELQEEAIEEGLSQSEEPFKNGVALPSGMAIPARTSSDGFRPVNVNSNGLPTKASEYQGRVNDRLKADYKRQVDLAHDSGKVAGWRDRIGEDDSYTDIANKAVAHFTSIGPLLRTATGRNAIPEERDRLFAKIAESTSAYDLMDGIVDVEEFLDLAKSADVNPAITNSIKASMQASLETELAKPAGISYFTSRYIGASDKERVRLTELTRHLPHDQRESILGPAMKAHLLKDINFSDYSATSQLSPPQLASLILAKHPMSAGGEVPWEGRGVVGPDGNIKYYVVGPNDVSIEGLTEIDGVPIVRVNEKGNQVGGGGAGGGGGGGRATRISRQISDLFESAVGKDAGDRTPEENVIHDGLTNILGIALDEKSALGLAFQFENFINRFDSAELPQEWNTATINNFISRESQKGLFFDGSSFVYNPGGIDSQDTSAIRQQIINDNPYLQAFSQNILDADESNVSLIYPRRSDGAYKIQIGQLPPVEFGFHKPGNKVQVNPVEPVEPIENTGDSDVVGALATSAVSVAGAVKLYRALTSLTGEGWTTRFVDSFKKTLPSNYPPAAKNTATFNLLKKVARGVGVNVEEVLEKASNKAGKNATGRGRGGAAFKNNALIEAIKKQDPNGFKWQQLDSPVRSAVVKPIRKAGGAVKSAVKGKVKGLAKGIVTGIKTVTTFIAGDYIGGNVAEFFSPGSIEDKKEATARYREEVGGITSALDYIGLVPYAPISAIGTFANDIGFFIWGAHKVLLADKNLKLSQAISEGTTVRVNRQTEEVKAVFQAAYGGPRTRLGVDSYSFIQEVTGLVESRGQMENSSFQIPSELAPLLGEISLFNSFQADVETVNGQLIEQWKKTGTDQPFPYMKQGKVHLGSGSVPYKPNSTLFPVEGFPELVDRLEELIAGPFSQGVQQAAQETLDRLDLQVGGDSVALYSILEDMQTAGRDREFTEHELNAMMPQITAMADEGGFLDVEDSADFYRSRNWQRFQDWKEEDGSDLVYGLTEPAQYLYWISLSAPSQGDSIKPLKADHSRLNLHEYVNMPDHSLGKSPYQVIGLRFNTKSNRMGFDVEPAPDLAQYVSYLKNEDARPRTLDEWSDSYASFHATSSIRNQLDNFGLVGAEVSEGDVNIAMVDYFSKSMGFQDAEIASVTPRKAESIVVDMVSRDVREIENALRKAMVMRANGQWSTTKLSLNIPESFNPSDKKSTDDFLRYIEKKIVNTDQEIDKYDTMKNSTAQIRIQEDLESSILKLRDARKMMNNMAERLRINSRGLVGGRFRPGGRRVRDKYTMSNEDFITE